MLIKEVKNEQSDIKITGSKHKCIKTTLSTSEKAFINILKSDNILLKPTGTLQPDDILELSYLENQSYKVPILPYDTIFETIDKKDTTCLCFNVLIHDSVDILDGDNQEHIDTLIDWCYQVLELKFDLTFFFNRWEGKLMKKMHFKKFNDEITDETLDFILQEESDDEDSDNQEVKNIIASKALLDDEEEAIGEEIIIKGFNQVNENKSLIQEVSSDNKSNAPYVKETSKESISNDLNF